MHEPKRVFTKPIAVSSEILLDRERCVLCQRCTRFSDQIAGDKFIDLLERGSAQQIGINSAEPFQSYYSGNTIQICPVGALTSAAYRFRARPFDLVSTDTVCEHCASGCALRTDHRAGAVTRRLARIDPRSTRSGTATRAASRSRTCGRATGSPGRWSASPTARWCPRPGPTPWRSPPAGCSRLGTTAGSAC